MFRRAQRQQAKLRLALVGPAGSGKTYSALRIATGLVQALNDTTSGHIAMIDTERGSGELYSDHFDYDIARLDPPFDPKRYIERIRAAQDAGYAVLIIDSLSHAWAGPGGLIDIKDNIAKTCKGTNEFTAWRYVTPQHNKLLDTILSCSCHVIATMRTKTAYEVTLNENGKTKPVKLGLAPIQRDGIEYEFTVVLDLSIDGHVATSSKDRTGLFDGKFFTPDEETGQALAAWLQSGQDPKQSVISTINDLLRKLELDNLSGAYWNYALNRYRAESVDALLPNQLDEQLQMLTQCSRNGDKLAKFRDVLSKTHTPSPQ